MAAQSSRVPPAHSRTQRNSAWMPRPLAGNPLAWVLAGALGGLLLGLLIGWVLWPVSWTNAWPGDLSPEAKAHYLAAVAEAYAYYGDDQAAEIAQNRLFDLRDDLGQEIAAAQAYFSENPQRNSRVYITYLGALAQRLGVESPNIIVEADASTPALSGETETGVQESSQDADDAGPNLASPGRSVVNWLLIVLAALILVGAGLVAINWLSRNRFTVFGPSRTHRDDMEEVDEFDDEFDDELVDNMDSLSARSPDRISPDTSPFRRPSQASPSGGSAEVRTATRTESRYNAPSADEYEFDAEADETRIVYSPGAPVDEFDDFDEYADDERWDEEQQPAKPNPYSPRPTDLRMDHAVEPAETPSHPGAVSSTPSDVHAQNQGRSAGQRAGPSGKVLGVFSAQFMVGVTDYSQTYNITDAESGRFIGECGMGQNIRHGILQSNPDQVVALEVWLYDKRGAKSSTNVSRVLMSEYAADHDMEQLFTRERPNEPSPVVAQPGLQFQLRGQELLLDCEIVDVSYATGGPAVGSFQTLQVDMTVRTKN